VSHGKEDSWVAHKIAQDVQECGASTFLDESDIEKGDDFKKIIQAEIKASSELIALFTPWSAQRFWVWVEVGAAWGQGRRIIAVLYGITVADLEKLGGSRAIFEDINVVELNKFEDYLVELRKRVKGNKDG
jgi:hypothetical protein